MALNGRNSGRGRRATNLPPKVWGAYVDAMRAARPGLIKSRKDIVERLRRDNGLTPEHLGKVLSGKLSAQPTFREDLADALHLASFGLSSTDLDLDIELFTQKLERDDSPSLVNLIEQARDGTRIELRPRTQPAPNYRHFGAGAAYAPPVGITPHQPHMLLFHRPRERADAQGYLLLLSFGLKDQNWQLVSSVADKPHAPNKLTQWSALVSDISLTAPVLVGAFILHAIGSPHPFPPAMISLFNNLRGTDGFLTARQLVTVTETVAWAGERGAWSASLHYVTN